MVSGASVARSHHPAGNEFGLRVESNPRPRITVVFALVILGDVLLFAPDERPNVVALKCCNERRYPR
jgi:hypothetical protein